MNERVYEPLQVEGLLDQIDAGTQALAEQVRYWHPVAPSPAELAAARRAVDGLGRLMAQLAQQQEARA